MPSAASASAIESLFVDECDRDVTRVAIPRPALQLVVRYGRSVPSGLDVHAMGARQTAHRKLIRRVQRSVVARLRLGAHEAVFGVPACAIAARIVALADLWGDEATGRLVDRLASARDSVDAAIILERAIAERVASADRLHAGTRFALEAAERLTRSSVRTVARELAVSERHLRRVFRTAVGVSPKTFAKLTRGTIERI